MKRPAAVFGLTLYAVLVLLRDRDISVYAAAATVSAVVFCITLLIFLKKRRAAALQVVLTAAAACLFICGAYTAKYTLVYQPAMGRVTEEKTELTGVVTEVGRSSGDYRYTLRCDGGVKILATSSADLFLDPCDSLTVSVNGIRALGGEDNRPYYMAKGVYLGARVEKYITSERGVSKNIFDLLARYREKTCRGLVYSAGTENGALLAGIVFGDTDDLSQRVKNAFSAAGISHIFAVSGFHVSTWAALVFFAVRMLRVRRKYAFMLPSAFVLLFIAVTGFPPSAIRAAVMAVILFSGNSFRLKSDLMNSLGAALTVICAAEPFSGGSTSLLLSVSAMLGVILFADHLYPAVGAGVLRLLGRRVPAYLFLFLLSVLLLSVTITAVMLPVMLLTFGRVSVIAPLANLIIVPFAEIAMPLGGVSALIGFDPGVRLAGSACGIMIRLTDRFASAFSLRAEFDLLPVLIAGAAFGAAFLIVKLLLKRRPPRGVFLFAAFLLCFCVSVFTSARNFDRIQVTAVSGSRMEALVRYRGFSMLVCDGKPSSGTESALTGAGIYDLDVLYLASDGNTRFIGETFEPRCILSPGDTGEASGNGIDLVFSPDFLRVEADGKTVVFLFEPDPAAGFEGADVLFVRSVPAETVEAECVVVPGKGGNSGNIYYTKNGFEYIS
ncbi:MAG: ComEC/Rec2 family competence protein [Clostridia bacterium]|nr:ComEC/Rec2 family competence protein [Clostridia bacterium]